MDRIKKLKLMRRNILWWKSDISIGSKLAYYPSLVFSHLRHLVTGKKTVWYLGRRLKYDNIATPLSLLTYPNEVSRKIKKNLNSSIDTMLDIGGNIGQFSLTSKVVMEPTKIDIIEPNTEIFDLLSENMKSEDGVSIYNVGIGPEGDGGLFFEKGRSGLGSVIKENAGKKNKVHKVDINLVSDVGKLTNRKSYDLIKIDVEGYEFNLLKHLKNVNCKYLFIEFSGGDRKLSGSHSETLDMINEKFGKFKILHISEAHAKSPSFEVLFEFIK